MGVNGRNLMGGGVDPVRVRFPSPRPLAWDCPHLSKELGETVEAKKKVGCSRTRLRTFTRVLDRSTKGA